MSKAFDLVDHGLILSYFLSETYHVLSHIFVCGGIVVNIYRLGGMVSFLHLFPYQMVYDMRGGVLSPILFMVYIDELLQHLQNLGVGCHWEGLFVGCPCYADDLALLASFAGALRKMLQVCSDFGAERNLSFNAEKTQL